MCSTDLLSFDKNPPEDGGSHFDSGFLVENTIIVANAPSGLIWFGTP
jgi:hypothetical protein